MSTCIKINLLTPNSVLLSPFNTSWRLIQVTGKEEIEAESDLFLIPDQGLEEVGWPGNQCPPQRKEPKDHALTQKMLSACGMSEARFSNVQYRNE